MEAFVEGFEFRLEASPGEEVVGSVYVLKVNEVS